MNTDVITYGNYTPVGDILVLAVCLTFAILVHVAYVSRTRNFMIFRNIMVLLMVAAVSDVLFHMSLNQADTMPHALIYTLRVIYHGCLFGDLLFYIIYIAETLRLDEIERRRYLVLGLVGYVLLMLYEIAGSVLRFGYYIEADGTLHTGFNIFPYGYVFFVGMLMYMSIHYRQRVYRQVLIGVLSTCGIAFLILSVQGRHGQSSFTTASFLFPAYALLYLIHANPYDIELGAVNVGGFEDMVAYNHTKKKELLLLSLLIPEYDISGKKFPKEIQETIRHFSSHFFRGGVLFQVSSGRMILTVPLERNRDYEETAKKMLDIFYDEHARYQLDYKIVITRSYGHISEENDYLGLIQYVEEKEFLNSVHWIEEKDIEGYRKFRYIVSELEDIHAKRDMYDPRVEVFCQPVFNLRTGKYDTAEALMRLRLEKTGMVFPDQFIPVAERFNYITVLSMIILSKTCAQIRALMEAGYYVRRISVNFSMIDLRDPSFSEMVNRIVRENQIPYEKVAIELTESQNEKDFMLVKERIGELKESGMKFYLDDFGTGYSSFERIMELPFDIIKFDRSLVIASSTDIKSETMVSYLAHMFSDMNYAVLYEGIENEEDEERCGRMCAKYLQGYKYSKPIPIAQLTEFFEKEETQGGVTLSVADLVESYQKG